MSAARPGGNGHRGVPEQGLPPDARVPGGGVEAAALLLVLAATITYQGLMPTSQPPST